MLHLALRWILSGINITQLLSVVDNIFQPLVSKPKLRLWEVELGCTFKFVARITTGIDIRLQC